MILYKLQANCIDTLCKSEVEIADGFPNRSNLDKPYLISSKSRNKKNKNSITHLSYLNAKLFWTYEFEVPGKPNSYFPTSRIK